MKLMERAPIQFKFFSACLLAISCAVMTAGTTVKSHYYIVDIDSAGFDTVNSIKQQSHVRWWVEAGEQLLVLADDGFAARINRPASRLDLAPRVDRLFVVQRGHTANLDGVEADLIISGGRKMVIQARSDAVPVLKDLHKHTGDQQVWASAHARLTLFQPNQVLARQSGNEMRLKRRLPWRKGVAEAVEMVDAERWFADVEYLASLNRNSYQDGVETARDWFLAKFEELGLDVRLQAFNMGSRTVHNVIAKIEGTERPDDWYIVGGHYDSTSENTRAAAPGAEDNASGAAGVLEMARVFAAHPPAATIYFIAFSGEEQGLNGSQAHIQELVASETHTNLRGVINMDMIGYSATPEGDLEVLLETEPVGTDLMNTLHAAADEYTNLEVFTTFDAWGSDHVPYLRRNVAAVLTIDNDYGSYPAYHRTTDTPEKVVVPMGVGILRMNVAALAELSF